MELIIRGMPAGSGINDLNSAGTEFLLMLVVNSVPCLHNRGVVL